MKIGNIDVSKLFIGGTAVSKAYLGATEVYTASKGIPNNEIWYTTSDGNPIADTVLDYNYTFDASGTALTLQSNTYKDGKGVLSYSGDIARIEGEDDENDSLGAFHNCSNLTKVTFPSSLKTLAFDTFVDCTILETVEFTSTELNMGNSCLWISDHSFKSKIRSIVIRATTAPTLNRTTLMYVAPQGTLYYPTGSDYSAWMTALESAQWKGKAVDDFSKLFYGMRLSPSSLTLDPNKIDTKLYVQCSEGYSLSVEGDIKDQILLPVGGGVADLTGAKTAFTVALKDINLTESKTGTITVKSATYSKTVPVGFYKYDYVETDGYSYITTDFIPDVNVNYRIESVQHYLDTDGTWTKMWGYSQEHYSIFDFGIPYTQTNLAGYYGQSSWEQSSINIQRKCTVILTPEKLGVKETDEWIYFNISSNKLSGTVTKPMTLGCDWENEAYTYPIWSDGETSWGPIAAKMRIYDFKIYNNDTNELVAHYVPIQDGKMYNTVSGYICNWDTKFQGETGTIRQKAGGDAKVISGNDTPTPTTER